MKILLDKNKQQDIDKMVSFLKSLDEEEQKVFKGFVDGFQLCRQIKKDIRG